MDTPPDLVGRPAAPWGAGQRPVGGTRHETLGWWQQRCVRRACLMPLKCAEHCEHTTRVQTLAFRAALVLPDRASSCARPSRLWQWRGSTCGQQTGVVKGGRLDLVQQPCAILIASHVACTLTALAQCTHLQRAAEELASLSQVAPLGLHPGSGHWHTTRMSVDRPATSHGALHMRKQMRQESRHSRHRATPAAAVCSLAATG